MNRRKFLQLITGGAAVMAAWPLAGGPGAEAATAKLGVETAPGREAAFEDLPYLLEGLMPPATTTHEGDAWVYTYNIPSWPFATMEFVAPIDINAGDAISLEEGGETSFFGYTLTSAKAGSTVKVQQGYFYTS